MIARVIEGYRFLGNLTDAERLLAGDGARKNRSAAKDLVDILRKGG